MWRNLLFWLLAFRTLNAIYIETYFQADEYFQSLEPAWQIAFGQHSGAWITWEWKKQLRSSIHPYMFALAYKVGDLVSRSLGWDRTLLLRMSPKLMQALIAATMDYFTYLFAAKHSPSGSKVPGYTLFLMVISPWQWFVSTRTLINSLECTLTAAALYYWPWDLFVDPGARLDRQRASLRKSLVLAALACVLRAPNVVIWVSIVTTCVVSAWVFDSRILLARLRMLISNAVLCGLGVLGISALVDWRYYGELTLPPVQFLKFNLVQDLAVFYGRNRGDYYLTEGVPMLTTTTIPFALCGMYRVLRKCLAMRAPWPPVPHQVDAIRDMSLVCAIVATIAALSMIMHKEARFIYPLLPMLTWLAAQPTHDYCRFDRLLKLRLRWRCIVPLLLLAINVSIAIYTTRYHQTGVIRITQFFRDEHKRHGGAGAFSGPEPVPMSVGFLMPCHSTPWRSHLIYPDIDAWALTCEPPIDLSPAQKLDYMDEADIFYKDPVSWLQHNMQPLTSIRVQNRNTNGKRQWPSYLVFFEALEPIMKDYLKDTPYTQRTREFNSHWHDDSRRKGDVVVWGRDLKFEKAWNE